MRNHVDPFTPAIHRDWPNRRLRVGEILDCSTITGDKAKLVKVVSVTGHICETRELKWFEYLWYAIGVKRKAEKAADLFVSYVHWTLCSLGCHTWRGTKQRDQKCDYCPMRRGIL